MRVRIGKVGSKSRAVPAFVARGLLGGAFDGAVVLTGKDTEGKDVRIELYPEEVRKLAEMFAAPRGTAAMRSSTRRLAHGFGAQRVRSASRIASPPAGVLSNSCGAPAT